MASPFLDAQPQPQPQPPPSELCFDDFSFDNLPMDSLFWADNDDDVPSGPFASDLDLAMGFGENEDYEITFEDIDNLHIPFDADDFLFPDGFNNPSGGSVSPPRLTPVKINDDHANSGSPESDVSAVSGDRSFDVSRFLNSQTSESEIFRQEEISLPVSVDNLGKQGSRNSTDVKVSSFRSLESDFCDRDESSGGPVSSQGSGNSGSGVYEVTKSPSPDSGRYERDISSHANAIADQDNEKLEKIGRSCDLKRKKQHVGGNAEARTIKCRRSPTTAMATENANQLCDLNEEEEKRKARLMRNRESAQLSRQRKKHYVEELEEKVRSMNSTIADLSSKISFVMAENVTLRQQLSAGGMCPAPGPGMYLHPPPIAPMAYPWVPGPPYVVKPQGSQVPLVPIPRLKSQQPVSATKTKKLDSKKTEGKTKKVASISFLGLFFFIMLFGGLVPLVNVKFGGLVDNVPSRSTFVSDRLYGQGGGKVWPVIGHRSESQREKGVEFSDGKYSVADRINYERGWKIGDEMHKERDSHSDEFDRLGNSSEPLLASLYVPRNDKLVKIDGNLIIHSIMASEKAMASQTAQTKTDIRETGLAIPKDWDSALAIPEVGRNRDRNPLAYRSPPEQRKALGSGSAETLKDHLKSTATDGKMQQWFREGLAGPMLSSGMCTEVFQFDASPAPGAVVPASSVANVSTENRQNATSLEKSRNRRILHRLPNSPGGSGLNITEEHVVRSSKNENLLVNKSTSSMVVSVLVDPKEAGGGDVDGMITPKSISRIFVVVLIDSVKYVTYSCGLPRASYRLVTA